MTEHTVAFQQELFLDCVQKVTDMLIRILTNMNAFSTSYEALL